MDNVFTILVIFYIVILGFCKFARIGTHFIEPQDLWWFVPFRVSGWKGFDGYIYKMNWIWDKVDFEENPKYKL